LLPVQRGTRRAGIFQGKEPDVAERRADLVPEHELLRPVHVLIDSVHRLDRVDEFVLGVRSRWISHVRRVRTHQVLQVRSSRSFTGLQIVSWSLIVRYNWPILLFEMGFNVCRSASSELYRNNLFSNQRESHHFLPIYGLLLVSITLSQQSSYYILVCIFFLIKNSDMVGQWQVVFFASCFNFWFCLESIKTVLHYTNGYQLFVATLSFVATDDYFRHQL